MAASNISNWLSFNRFNKSLRTISALWHCCCCCWEQEFVCLLLQQQQQYDGVGDDDKVSVSPAASCSRFTTRAFQRRLAKVFRLVRNMNMKAHSWVFQCSIASSAKEGHLGATIGTSYTRGSKRIYIKRSGAFKRHS
jgi:hypothetical protein